MADADSLSAQFPQGKRINFWGTNNVPSIRSRFKNDLLIQHLQYHCHVVRQADTDRGSGHGKCVPLNKVTCFSFGWEAKGSDKMSISVEMG